MGFKSSNDSRLWHPTCWSPHIFLLFGGKSLFLWFHPRQASSNTCKGTFGTPICGIKQCPVYQKYLNPYRSLIILISSHPLAELQLYHGVAPTPSHILWTMRLCPHRRTNDFHKFIDWKVSIAPRCCGNSLGMRCSGQMLCHVSAISSRNTESQHWGSRHLDLGPTPRRS
jgi:hypothetical protein